ncbi:hypothetical protein HL669_23515 [Vibrio parahaemolyticus]|uniref:hypothetical protein n=1 Tax=Vibrio parahaemolyticus TaxID=670 RepID=UPI0014851B24|nr:hypothetical protein [Vibrio parahaemolyticus]ELB2105282.1 hypothetical protein [Vibrio parahaemolyticus]NNU14570.1 hypothetical protein [Vibrio parahaemolyticus]
MPDLLFSPIEERMLYEYTTEWQFVALSRVPANQQRTGKMPIPAEARSPVRPIGALPAGSKTR